MTNAGHLPRRYPAWLPGLLLATSLAGCGGRGAEPEAVRIGVLVNLPGSEGPPTVEAVELAAAAVNAAGGIEVGGARRPVELFFEETQTAPEKAIEGARRLIQRQVVALIGPSRSRDAIAAAGAAEHARIPMISAAATHPQLTAGKSYVFRVTFTDRFQGEALGRFAVEGLGGRTAGILYDDASAYNRNLAMVFREAFESFGGQVVAFEHYTTGDMDFRRQLEIIRAAEPQVLFLPNYVEEIPTQARQARELGIGAVLLGGDSWTLVSLADQPYLEGAFFGVHWHLDETAVNSEARRFATAYRQAYGHDPSTQAALTYDAFGLLAHAIRRAGSDPEEIRQALAEIEGYPGVTGPITFRSSGGDPPKPLVIARIEHGIASRYMVIEP